MGDFWIWSYELRTLGALNSKTTRRAYPGALVRNETGFGCLHPWPELGDPTLKDCLVDLAHDQESALVRRTLDCLRVDGRARGENRSLFEGLQVPSSHATLPLLDEVVLSEAVKRGFTCVKVKGGKGGGVDLRRIRLMMPMYPELK